MCLALLPAVWEAGRIHFGLELELSWIPVIWGMLEQWCPHSPGLGPYWAESSRDRLRMTFPKAGAQRLKPLSPMGIGGVPRREAGTASPARSILLEDPSGDAAAFCSNGMVWVRCWKTLLRWGGKEWAQKCPDGL